MLDLKYSLISYNVLDVCNKKLIISHLTCASCMWKYMPANAKQLTLSVIIWLGESSQIMYKIIPEYIWKTQIDLQSLKDVQSSNICPIPTSYTYGTSDLSPVFKLTPNSQIYVLFHILKCMTISHVLKSTSTNATELCPYPNSNQ